MSLLPTIESDKIKGPKFWIDDPNVLLQKEYIFEFFPVETMTYEQKLNAVSRAIILLSIISFILTKNIRIIIISIITLFSIFIMYFYQDKEKSKIAKKKEAFEDAGIALLSQNSIPIPENTFTPPTTNNPFGNVLMPDYDYNPKKLPAPPS